MTSLKAALIGLAAGIAAPAPAQETTIPVAARLAEAAATSLVPGTVVVSCFRGPWRETLWDRPEGVFLDSLVGLGYDYTAAEAIGERVCKDEALVGDPTALRAAVERILAASPAGG